MAYRIYEIDAQMQLGRSCETMQEAAHRRELILRVFPDMRMVILGEGKMANEREQEK